MKAEYFSEEILQSHIDDLKKQRTNQQRFKKSQIIIDWLEWLKRKQYISEAEYELSLKKVKKHTHISTLNLANVVHYIKKSYLKVSIYILILFLVLGVLWKFYSYWRSTQKNVRTGQLMSEKRILPYKGTLLDEDGLPITTKKDIIFRIYTAPAVGQPVYVGSCIGENGIVPDYNGSFTIVLGSDCGMPPIPESIFKTQKEIYLGVQLGSSLELTPRQKISTSGYSSDAAKLQGLPLGDEKDSIPFINREGQVIFKHADPVIKTITGTFTIESPSLTLKTSAEENASILFQPAANGNTIIGNGKFAVGTFSPDHLMSVEGVEPFESLVAIKNLAPEDNDSVSVLKLYLGSAISAVESTFVKFYAETTSEDEGLEVGGIRLNNEGVAYETAGADFAEYFDTDVNNIPSGYIVTLSSEGIHKSHVGETIIGVTSDKAGFVGNKNNASTNQTLIALVGQVDIYITNIHGEIHKGDSVGLSDIPGYGAREKGKNQIVGYALENTKDAEKIICSLEIIEEYGNDIICGKLRILLK